MSRKRVKYGFEPRYVHVMTEEEVQEMRDTFIKRIERLEKALSEIYPGWDYGAHTPGCSCAACDSY